MRIPARNAPSACDKPNKWVAQLASAMMPITFSTNNSSLPMPAMKFIQRGRIHGPRMPTARMARMIFAPMMPVSAMAASPTPPME